MISVSGERTSNLSGNTTSEDRTESADTNRLQEVEAEYGPTNVTITCIGVDSLSDENNGVMWVTSGGIGHNFIRIKFRSKYSRGLRYRVYVYGKPY
ncbi:uncharacterized protein LOC143340575 isoform X2 [Colletes latitarsis]|uniref:uncharacterized protein LOC143340575 isoform X2 n=1 Tax=Colletes latitarsis TaxID=2605962 RepID=UPI004035EBE8